MAVSKLSQIASGSGVNTSTDAIVTVRSGTTDVLTTLGTLASQSGTFSGTSSGTNTGDQTITLTGDVTGSGTGSFAASIGSNKVTTTTINTGAVTYPKIQTTTQAALLGASSATTVGEITLGTNLTFSGSVLNAASTAATAFSAITGSTNTTAAMVVGTGASIAASGSGAITATAIAVGGITGLGTGVGTFLATPSSANLAAALTDETGTGAAVFANTPTLIAPLLGTPTSGVMTNVTGTAAGLTAGAVSGNPNKRSIGAGSGVPASGTVVATGRVQYVQVPFAGTITGYAIMADQSGSIVVDIWKANAAIPTVANTITASALPTLSSSQYINSTTLTAWTTSVAVNDVFAFNVNSATTLNSFSIVLFIATS